MKNDYLEEPLIFECEDDRLVGILHRSDGSARLGILFVVGGPQYRVGSHRMFVLIARHLARAGFVVLRFDVRGMGDSQGHFSSFEALDTDIRSAIDAFESAVTGLDRVAILGLCDGASAAALYCGGDPRVAGLILLNPWVHTRTTEAKTYISTYYPRRILQLDFWYKVVQGRWQILDSLRDFWKKLRWMIESRYTAKRGGNLTFVDRMANRLSRFGGPVLIVTSENDLTASEFTNTLGDDRTWKEVGAKVTLCTLAEADHTLSSPAHLESFSRYVNSWLSRNFCDKLSRKLPD